MCFDVAADDDHDDDDVGNAAVIHSAAAAAVIVLACSLCDWYPDSPTNLSLPPLYYLCLPVYLSVYLARTLFGSLRYPQTTVV